MSLESSPGAGSTFHVYLPLPSLASDAASAPAGAQPVLLLVSLCEPLPPAIANLCKLQGLRIQRLRPGDDLNTLLPRLRPTALAWDFAQAGEEEWRLLRQLRAHPQISRLPLVVFGHGSAAAQPSGVTSVLGKPLRGKTLIDAIEALHGPAAGGSVLIVDDDQNTRMLYRELVGQALPGFPIRLADGGRAALDMLKNEVPSLVILDLSMPEVDGFTVLEQLRGQPATRQVPVIIMSGKELAAEDVKRLDYALVMFQSKEVLSREEAVALLSGALGGGWLPRPTSLVVKQVVAYMQQHHHRELSRQEIAEAVGVSKNYLTQIFHQELGILPWEYLNRYRIRRASKLLRETDRSITAVAECVGFEDASYFARVFRKQIGCSPQSYRERER
jgi:AraC-like DNA-binding protein